MKSKVVALCFIAVIIIFTTVPAFSAVIRVKGDSPNNGPGNDWDHAFRTVKAGLDAAVPGDEVWVAKGTYVERINLKDEVGLYGGFVGNETSRDQRNHHTNITILDGNKNGSVVTATWWISETCVIDGFTIRNGSANNGGGIYCYYSSPTITNNTICDNVTTFGSGGGIHCYCSSPIISNNIVRGNSSKQYGGGICCEQSSPTIYNNTITDNHGGFSGGGICNIYGAFSAISNNIIKGNSTEFSGGGVFCDYGCTVTVSNNIISENTSKCHGGGVCCLNSDLEIINNVISDNNADLHGGGICSLGCSPLISRNTITGNHGGISNIYAYFGGGIFTDTSATITNNIIAFNSSGVFRNGSNSLVIRNNCIYGNADFNYHYTIPFGKGDMFVDPKLVKDGSGVFHIQPDSPCRDAGNDNAVEPESFDIEGQARVQGAHVDIGADESDGTVWNHIPTVVRVKPDGDDASDGSSWIKAKRTVQAGIDALSSTGGEVWVARGTYLGTITLKDDVSLYGGFSGDETSREQRNHRLNITVLDGNQNESVVSTAQWVTATCTIDGFTIRNGNYGIYCYYASPTITNNIIADNNYTGMVVDNCTSMISDNIIRNNLSEYAGGGIVCGHAWPTITNNIISGNGTSNSYGGITCFSAWPTIANNIITKNSGVYGGGIYSGPCCIPQSNCRQIITNNIIADNTAFTDGGGLYCTNYSPIITNNTITGNTAGSNGGAIYSNNCSPDLYNNIIAFNSSGIYQGTIGTPILKNNCVYNPAGPNYSGTSAGTDDISVDPLFANRTTGDYHLMKGSLCINAGWDQATGITVYDFDNHPRRNGRIDIGAYEYWLPSALVKEAKFAPESASVTMSGVVVSAVFNNCCYVESPDRCIGIRVNGDVSRLHLNDLVDVSGITETNSDGERCVTASTIKPVGQGEITPLLLNNAAIGGGTFGYQQGIWRWQSLNESQGVPNKMMGLNNIGLLVKTCGCITYSGDGFFYVDDGSNIDDNSGHKGVKVYGSVSVEAGTDPIGKMVMVTGVSSCERSGDDPVSVIRTRSAGDVVIIDM